MGTRNLPYPDGTLPVELAFLGALPHDPGLRATAEESSKLTPVNFSVIQRLRPTSYYWKPYIIPPLLTKIAGQTSNPLIENSWFQARGAIAFADSVHLLGYSMPPSDFEMEMLLREGLHSRVPYKPNRRVFVVNRDVMTAKRIKTILEFGDVTIDISRSDIIDHLTAILPELTG